jgi:trimeric autotransporter adhesin
MPFSAFADELVVDGDDLVGTNLSFGEVCLNDTANNTVLLRLLRTQTANPQIFQNGSTVDVTASSVTGSGLNVAEDVGTITVPSDWSSRSENSISGDSVTSTVSFTPSSIGGFSGQITYQATGQNNQNGNPLTRTETISVSATVIDCAPSLIETNLDVDPVTATVGTSADFSATLTAEGAGVEGKQVDFSVDGTSIGSAATGANGVATVNYYTPAIGGIVDYTINASFAGDDDYEGSIGSNTLTIVDLTTPTITWSDPVDITYGTELDNTQLNATADVDGTFSYNPNFGTVLDAGTHTLNVEFTPDDTVNYNTANASVSLTVLQAAGSVSITNIPDDAVYGGSFTPEFSVAGDGSPSAISLTETTCSIEDGMVSFTGVGECTLEPSVTEGSNHAAATGDPQSFTIGQTTATITLSDLSHSYDGEEKAATVTTNPTGLSGVSVTYDDGTDLPVDAGSYAVEATLDNPNYSADPVTDTLVISKAEVTITLDELGHTYDGTPKSATVSTDPEGLEVITVTYDGETDAPVNAGSYEVIATLDHPNYTGQAIDTLTIAQADQTISFPTIDDVTYGTEAFALIATATSGLPVAYSASGDCVIDNGMVQITGAGQCEITASQAGDDNYNAAEDVTRSFNIDQKNLTVSGAVAENKIYNGDANATVNFDDAVLNGVESDDDVSLDTSSYSASFEDPNVGTDKSVAVTGVALAGDDAANYTVSQPSGLTADITPLEITGSFTVANKIYDGDTDATITGRSLSGVLDDDDVELTGGTASFSDKNAGDAKTVTGTGLNLSGDDAGNYTLESTTLTTTASISPLEVTVSITADNKVYDGNTSANASLDGVSPEFIEDDDVDVVLSNAQFASSDAGTWDVAADLALSGDDAGNYELASGTASATATIDPLIVTGSFTAADKDYDGNTDATVTGSSVSPQFLDEDDVQLDVANAQFDDAGAGENKVVTGDLSLTGTDAANYALASSTATASATINPLEITGSFAAADKIYDGDTEATITGRSLSGVLDEDDVELTGGTASFSDKNAGDAKTVTGTGFNLSGDDADNYTLASSTLTTTASITPLEVTVSITASDKTYDGTTSASVTVDEVSPDFIENDDVSVNISNAQFEDANAGQDKTVTADLALLGDDAGNYVLSSDTATTTADIDPRPITVTADDHYKTVGENDPELTYTYDEEELVEGDEFSGELEREDGEGVGTYPITQGSLTLGPNYDIDFAEGTLTIGYGICVDFNEDKSKKAGATIPVRIELCDSEGNNISSRDITVSAYQLVKTSNGASNEIDPEDAGNANPDDDFRFAGDRYIYNLNTRGMSNGTWKMKFAVDGVQHESYYVTIQLKK